MTVVEVLTVLLSLTDFGVKPSPRAPAATELMRWAPTHADVAVHVDFAAFVPNNHAALTKLSETLPAGSEAKVALDTGLAQIAVGRAAIKVATGVDPIGGLTSATGFLEMTGSEPAFVVVVRGAFPDDFLKRAEGMGDLGATRFEVDGKVGLVAGPVAATQLGKEVLIGTRPWIEARMKKGFQRGHGPGDALIARAFTGRPFVAVALDPSDAVRQRLLAELQGTDDGEAAVARAMLEATRRAELHATATGLGWSLEMSDAAGAESARLASEGAFHLLRAEQFFAQAVVDLGFAVLPAARREHPDVIAAIEARRDDVMTVARALAGDGRFVSSVTVKKNRVTAEARAKSIGQIVGVVPMMAAGGFVFLAGRTTHAELSGPVAVKAAEVKPIQELAPPAKVLDVRGIHRRVKAQRGR